MSSYFLEKIEISKFPLRKVKRLRKNFYKNFMGNSFKKILKLILNCFYKKKSEKKNFQK